MNGLVKINAPELQNIDGSKAVQIKAVFEPMIKMLFDFEEEYNKVITESEAGSYESCYQKS